METWKQWEPAKNLPSVMYNLFLLDNKKGLTLTFQDVASEKQVVFKFDGLVLSYRNTDEGSLLDMLYRLNRNYGKDFYAKKTLFQVQDSEYINWFLKESSGVYEKEEIKHFVFMTSDDVIEILSTYCPKVTIIKQ